MTNSPVAAPEAASVSTLVPTPVSAPVAASVVAPVVAPVEALVVDALTPSDPLSMPPPPPPRAAYTDIGTGDHVLDVARQVAENESNQTAETSLSQDESVKEEDDAKFAFKLAMSFRREDRGRRNRRKPQLLIAEPPALTKASAKRKAPPKDLDEQAAEGLVALVFGEASSDEEEEAAKTAGSKRKTKKTKGKGKTDKLNSQSKRTIAQFAERCEPDDCKIDHFERCTNIDEHRQRCRNPRTVRTRCGLHVGGKKCSEPGCSKFSIGGFNLCIGHGGGRRCRVPQCQKHARGGGLGLCGEHGGGKPCDYKLAKCPSKAVSGSTLCKAHGGGKRCVAQDCNKSAQGPTPLCVGHGGGNRCTIRGCKTAAVPPSKNRCLTHGGGRRCQEPGCPKPARSPFLLCMRHWKRCSVDGCKQHAMEHGLCKVHCVEDINGEVTL